MTDSMLVRYQHLPGICLPFQGQARVFTLQLSESFFQRCRQLLGIGAWGRLDIKLRPIVLFFTLPDDYVRFGAPEQRMMRVSAALRCLEIPANR